MPASCAITCDGPTLRDSGRTARKSSPIANPPAIGSASRHSNGSASKFSALSISPAATSAFSLTSRNATITTPVTTPASSPSTDNGNNASARASAARSASSATRGLA